MKRKILKDFELTEISGVDRPAQPTAKMAIMKRKDSDDDESVTTQTTEKRGATMPEENKDELNVLKGQVETLTKQLKDANELAKMSDMEKEYMSGMSDDEKKKYMAMTPEERKKMMDVKKSADETLLIGDQTIRKSVVGDAMFVVLKSQQEQLAKQEMAIKKAQEAAEMATLTKRASEEFSHIPGTSEEIAKCLKAISALDEPVRKTFEQILKSAEGNAKPSFQSLGHGNGQVVKSNSAMEELDKLAKQYQDQHKCSYEVAYSETIMKRADLYDRAIQEGN